MPRLPPALTPERTQLASGARWCSASLTQSAGVPAMVMRSSSSRVTLIGAWVVTWCPHPELGLLGAAIRQRPRPSAPCRSASRPGASQPSSLVRSKVGRLSLNDSTFAATFLEYPVRSQDKVGDEKPVSQAAMIGLPAV